MHPRTPAHPTTPQKTNSTNSTLCSFVAAVAGRVNSEAHASSDAGGVRALVDAIKKEEVHVSVDLHSKLKVLTKLLLFTSACTRRCETECYTSPTEAQRATMGVPGRRWEDRAGGWGCERAAQNRPPVNTVTRNESKGNIQDRY